MNYKIVDMYLIEVKKFPSNNLCGIIFRTLFILQDYKQLFFG